MHHVFGPDSLMVAWVIKFFFMHSHMLQSLVHKDFTASLWVKAVADVIGGEWKGSSVSGQTSSPNNNKLSEALSIAREFANLKLE